MAALLPVSFLYFITLGRPCQPFPIVLPVLFW